MSFLANLQHQLSKNVKRRDNQYWPHYWDSTGVSTTEKAYDYIPRLIQHKCYFHESPQHRLQVAKMNPIANYLVFDVPKMMFKDFFHFEDKDGKEILEEKIYMLEDMGAKEALTLVSTFERLDGWGYLVYFDDEKPRFDARTNTSRYDKLIPGKAMTIKAYPSTAATVLDVNDWGYPSKLKFEVYDANEAVKWFTVDESRFTLVRTRPYDQSYKGASIMEAVWDPIVLVPWVMHAMGARSAREGAGYRHVQFPDEDLTDEDSIADLAAEFQALSSSKGAYTSDKVNIDEKGFGPHAVPWNIIMDVLLDLIAIGTGYPRDVLKGIQSGRVTGGEVNEKGVYAALNAGQVDLNPTIKDMNRKCFKNMKQKHYKPKHNLTFRMTEKDQAETEKIKAETNNIKLGWMKKNEIRVQEGLPEDEEFEEKEPIPLTNPEIIPKNIPQKPTPKLLPAPTPKDEKKDFTLPAPNGSYRTDFFNESLGNLSNNGVELIAPVTLAREGTYEYKEHGTTEFLSYEELVKAAKYTPSLPIVLDDHVPLGSESVKIQYGVVKNIRGDNKGRKLIGEAHFFLDKTPEEYVELIKSKKPIEGSIGKYIGEFGGSGMFKGVAYDAEQKSIKMMHYAVSNKFVGKCSVQMGCGVNQP